jgi:hypothetical protein
MPPVKQFLWVAALISPLSSINKVISSILLFLALNDQLFLLLFCRNQL